MVDWPGDEDWPGRNYGDACLEEDRFLSFRDDPAESTDHRAKRTRRESMYAAGAAASHPVSGSSMSASATH